MEEGPSTEPDSSSCNVQDLVLLEQGYTDIQKSGCHQTLVRPSKVICNYHHTEGTQILGVRARGIQKYMLMF